MLNIWNREKRLDQERELLVRQQRLLQDELDVRTKEVMNIRREKTSKVIELQTDLSEKIEEVSLFVFLFFPTNNNVLCTKQLKIAKKTIGELTTTVEFNEKHIKEVSDKLKELGETEVKMSENNR